MYRDSWEWLWLGWLWVGLVIGLLLGAMGMGFGLVGCVPVEDAAYGVSAPALDAGTSGGAGADVRVVGDAGDMSGVGEGADAGVDALADTTPDTGTDSGPASAPVLGDSARGLGWLSGDSYTSIYVSCESPAVRCVRSSSELALALLDPVVEAILVGGGTYSGFALSGRRVLIVGGYDSSFATREPARFVTEFRGDGVSPVISLLESSVDMSGVRIVGGGGVEGGGIYSRDSTLRLSGCEVSGNDVSAAGGGAFGGGIAFGGGGGTLTVVGSVFSRNRAGRGGAIASGLSSTVTLSSVDVLGNVAVGDHGGGLSLSGRVSLTDVLVSGNRVLGDGWGGGVLVFDVGTVASLVRVSVVGNTAPGGGSGVFIDDGAVADLSGVVFSGNGCSSGGSSLYVDGLGGIRSVARVVGGVFGDGCPVGVVVEGSDLTGVLGAVVLAGGISQ